MAGEAVAGTVFGTIGLLGQIITGCASGFDLWGKAEGLQLEAIILQLTLEMARTRLIAWGDLWTLENGSYCQLGIT
jgi:Prion-inhibition and propagation